MPRTSKKVTKPSAADKESAVRETSKDDIKIDSLSALFERYPSGEKVEKIDTGSLSLNKIFGGGYPLGKYIQLYSDEGLGKTTIALTIAKALADHGYKTVYLDIEKALNEELLDGMGLTEYVRQEGEDEEAVLANNRMIFIHKLDTFKEIETIMQFYIKLQQKNPEDFKIGTFVFDSLTALLSESLMTKDIEDATIGIKARLQGALLEKYKAFMYSNQISTMLLNQKRMKIGMGWGEITKAVAAGGYALKFYSDIIINLEKKEWIKDTDKQIYGVELNMMADKNKFVAPKLTYPIHIIFGKGISNVRTVAHFLIESGQVKKAGAWYKIDNAAGEELVFQGENQLFGWINDNYDYAMSLFSKDRVSKE